MTSSTIISVRAAGAALAVAVLFSMDGGSSSSAIAAGRPQKKILKERPSHRAQRDYGLLGNGIAGLVDSLSAQSDSKQADAAPSTQRAQRDYGLLGNVIAGVIDGFSARSGPKQTRAAPPTQRRQRDYGLLGNLIAGLVDSFSIQSQAKAGSVPLPRRAEPRSGASRLMEGEESSAHFEFKGAGTDTDEGEAHDAAMENDQDPATPASPPIIAAETQAATKKEQTSARPLIGLQSVRELVRALVSNFLPDTSFDRAADALKQRDRLMGLDAAPGEGGFVSAKELQTLQSLAGGNH